MALFTAKSIDRPPVTGGQAGVVVCNEGEYSVPNTLAANDIVKLAHLPAGHKPVDVILESGVLDSNGTPTITVSAGVVNDAGDDLVAGTNFITTSGIAKTGGVARADTVAGLQLAASNTDRVIGVKITNVAATKAAGKLRLKVLSVPA